jgi:hypothetical protein
MRPILDYLPLPKPKATKVAATLADVLLDLGVLALKPNDVVIVRSAYALTKAQVCEMQEQVCGVLPTGTKVLILDGGLEIGVIRPTE